MEYTEYFDEFISFQIYSKLIHLYRDIERDTRGKNFILWYLSNNPDPVFPKDIAKFLHTSTAHIAILLNQMEHDGLIERHTCSTDNRKTRLLLTETGRDAAEAERKRIVEEVRQLFDYLGEDDMRELLRIQKRILAYSAGKQK